MADEFFNDILDEHFAEEEVQRQFETATNWGRYAEIFDYDRATGRLTQTEPTSLEPPPAPAVVDSPNSTPAPES
jgi:NitT/TauT family transport system ATP-binding protein